MFTGIVEELGRVRRVDHHDGGARLEIGCERVLDDAQDGASIAVNGCCLTVVGVGDGWWAADAVVETLERTSLGGLRAGDPVNLERPVRLADRLGGHIVQGHVDGVGTVSEAREDGFARVVTIAAPAELLRYVVEKGSIAVDGVSLTVSAIAVDSFSVSLIPETLERTNLGSAQPGQPVNLEVDVLAKYVEKLVGTAA